MSDGCINIRGNAENAEFLAAARDVLGQDLPVQANTTTRDAHVIYWLGPDEWLVTTAPEQRTDVLTKLEQAMSSMHVALNDLSAGNITLKLKGAGITDVLSKGCTLDFHEFAVGTCAQSGLGKAGVLIGRDDENEYTVIVRRSFADYLQQWLQHAASDHEIEFG